MVTINPHTTRATGTVLTAAIYNTDHQNHVTNATSINNDAAYKNVANTFTANQTINPSAASASLALTGAGNAQIELGRTDGVASIPLIDFHSGATAVDFDSRISASGGTGSNGGGNLAVAVSTLTVNGNLTVTGTLTGAASAFPAGTIMLFQQTAAPTGWTKLTVENNKALRLTTGSVTTGGSVSFTTAFASQAVTGTNASTTSTGTVGGTALTEANLPVHSHGVGTLGGSTSTDGAHTHSINFNPSGSGSTPANNAASAGSPVNTTSAGSHSHTLSITGSTANTGSGTTHTHSLTMNSHTHTFTGNAINLAVQYVDVILASKD